MENKNDILVGITGPTGAGKSLVTALLSQRGYAVIDADQVARQVVEKGKKCLLDLALEFGIEILEADGSLNRRKLGSMVFGDKEKRKALNRITFPYIQEELFEQVAKLHRAGHRFVFLDAPTLFESGTDKRCQKIVSVVAPKDERLGRILQRDGLTLEEARNRMNSQHEDEFYTTRSQYVIENNGDAKDLTLRVMEMLEAVGAAENGQGK